MDLSKTLDSIELKVRHMTSRMERLHSENERLTAENQQLKTDLDRQQGLVGVLKDKLERTQREIDERKQGTDTIDREAMRQHIDQCLSEIDKCIEWLQQQ